MEPMTFETLIADQKERIERRYAKKGDNLIMDFINDINDEIELNKLK